MSLLLLVVAAACFGLAALKVSAPVDFTALGLLLATLAVMSGLIEPRIR